jgi:hypothetical protein
MCSCVLNYGPILKFISVQLVTNLDQFSVVHIPNNYFNILLLLLLLLLCFLNFLNFIIYSLIKYLKIALTLSY